MTIELKNGDCLELMKSLPDKSIDLFICDLPYGETNCKWDSKIDLEEFWKQFKRLRRSKKTACIHFCSTKFGYSLIKSWEKGFKMDMVWKKRNKTGGLQSKYRPMRNHEMLYFFYEQAPKYNRDKYHKRIKSHSAEYTPSKEVTAGGTMPYCGTPHHHDPPNPVSVIEAEDPIYGEKKGKRHDRYLKSGTGAHHPPCPGSVVVEDDEPVSMFESEKVFIGKRHHQTEKPQDILEFFLKYWTDEGDTVLDPTMGSGSTGVACKKMGRNFIGIELDEKIFKVAENRCAK